MQRRAYLTTAAAVTFAGCSALTDSDPPEENGDDDNGDDDSGNGDDNGDGNGNDPIDEEPGSFDEFEDLSKWTVMEGTLEADADRVYAGTQSARLEADASDDRVMIKREFDSPRNLSDEFPALAFASDHDVSPTVQITDTDGDRLLLQCSVRADRPLLRRDQGIVDVVGDPDLESIEHTKISVWVGDRELSLWCDDYHFVERPDTGKVLVQFPRGTDSVGASAASILDEYDFPATVFVNTDFVGTDGRLSLEQLETLHDHGWTVASQSATNADLTEQDESGQDDQIGRAADWLADHGFDDTAFSYPQNQYDETTLEVVDEYHDLAFVAGHTGHGHVTTPGLVPRAAAPDGEEAVELLERTADYRTITTLAYRDLDGSTLVAFEKAISKLATLEQEGKIDVVSPDDIASGHLH